MKTEQFNSSLKTHGDLRAVVVGLGSIGNRHLRNLIQAGVGEIIVVRRADRQNTNFQVPETCRCVLSIEEAIDLEPDFAIICNPSHLHVSVAKQFISTGIACLIEKPLAGSLDSATNDLVSLRTPAAMRSALAYCMRYHPAYEHARQLVRTGQIGRCLYAKAWFEGYLPDWHPWEDHRQSYAALTDQAGGALRTLDHEIDFLNWVLGDAISSTGMCMNTDAIEIQADDVAHVISHHPDRVTSAVTLAFCRKPSSRGFQIVGTDASLEFSMEASALLIRNTDGDVKHCLQTSGDDITNMYIRLLDDFLSQWTTEDSSAALARLTSGAASLRVLDSIQPLQNVSP